MRLLLTCLVMFLLGSACLAASRLRSEELGEQVYHKAVWALETVAHTRYHHNDDPPIEQVKQSFRTGDYIADCDGSGFVSWLIYEISPQHLYAVESLQPGRECPLAKTFAHFFAALPRREVVSGWLGVPKAIELTPGDLIAWDEEKRPGKHGNTGHVMVVAALPGEPEEITVDGTVVRYLSVRVIDSSSVYHFPPEKLPPFAQQKHRDGLGEGYIRLVLDQQGRPIAHWEGTYWGEGGKDINGPSPCPIISCGRLVGPALHPSFNLQDIENIRPRGKGQAKFAF